MCETYQRKDVGKQITPFLNSYNQMQDYLLQDQKVTVHRDGTCADVDKSTKMEKYARSEIAVTPHAKRSHGTTFVNPLLFIL